MKKKPISATNTKKTYAILGDLIESNDIAIMLSNTQVKN